MSPTKTQQEGITPENEQEKEESSVRSSKKQKIAKPLEDFMVFMSDYSDWVLKDKEEDRVLYVKHISAKKPSCIIAILLLCIMILPGILYLFLAGRQSKEESISLLYNHSTDSLIFSGTKKGRQIYNKFLENRNK